MRALPLAVAGALLTLSGTSPAAGQAVKFGHLTIEDGLSHNWVLSILEDRQGFLWFGTQDGLNRYDGAGFKVYRHDPDDPSSLPSSVAGVLYEDGKGRLWVGSFWGNAGVALYDRARDGFETFLPNAEATTGNNVRAILEDRTGVIWLGTDNGVARLDPEQKRIRRLPLGPETGSGALENLVVSLFEDSRGRLWVGTSAGLLGLDRQTGQYSRWPGREADPNGLDRADVWAFHEDADGALWIATLGAGLHRLDPRTGRETLYLPDPTDPGSIANARVTRIVPDGKGKLYLGTENGGLNVFDVEKKRFTRFLPDVDDETSLNSRSVWSLYLDGQGTLWIGTFNGGVNHTSRYLQRFEHIRAGRGRLNDPHVASVLEDERGFVWVGTDGAGLNRLDLRTGAFAYYRSQAGDPATIGSDAVWALFEDSRGILWLGGWDGGLGRFDRATGRVRRYRHDPRDPRTIVSNHVWRILELSTGELLVVTQAGADLFDRDTGAFRRLTDLYPGAGEDVLYAGAEDDAGRIWLGGNSFVGSVDRGTGRVTRYRHDPEDAESLGSGWVQAIHVDTRGNVWFGTQGGLSCLTARTNRWVRYTTEDGLSHDIVVGILEDAAGSIWVSTSRGLDRIVDGIDVPDHPRVFRFDARDGIQAQEFARGACFRSRSGRLYFGGAQGLNAFRPEAVVSNPRPPKVVLTGLEILNKPVRPGTPGSPLATAITEADHLRLTHRDSVVTFRFAALNYVLPGKNQYAYMLEGFEPDWNYVGSRHTATYTNLPRGRSFTFRVKASNNDGVWNEEGLALPVEVVPRWWERRRNQVLGLFLLAIGGVAAYRRRVSVLEGRERELARRVDEQTADLQREVAEHKRTEERLARENQERRRAEEVARESAARLESTNANLLAGQEALRRENAERTRAEEEAGRERDLLHALMDNIPDLIYFKDASHRFVRVNRAQAEALGASVREAVGRTDADYVDRDSARAMRDEERELFRTGRPIVGKVQHDARRGRFYLVTKVPLRDASGSVTGLVGISKDITERKTAEERLGEELQRYLGVVSTVARGDLTLRGAEGDDTLGRIARSTNEMLAGFSAILSEVRDAALSVSSAASEILTASMEIAKGAQYGSDQVYTTSAAVEEMAVSMTQVSRNAGASSDKAQLVLEHVREGDRAVGVAHEGMSRIDVAATETAEKMRLLEARSREIFEIVDLIDDLASESELLSLNAAIEAAHAGDSGRGFAVVAQEVRRLAKRSRDAMTNVSSIVDTMIEEVRAALGAMENVVREVQEGRALSTQAIKSLEEISTLVQDSSGLSAQISAAAREQAQVTKSLSDSMQAIANVTHESAAGARGTSTAVQDLVSLSEQLIQAISRFRIDTAGPGRTP